MLHNLIQMKKKKLYSDEIGSEEDEIIYEVFTGLEETPKTSGGRRDNIDVKHNEASNWLTGRVLSPVDIARSHFGKKMATFRRSSHRRRR